MITIATAPPAVVPADTFVSEAFAAEPVWELVEDKELLAEGFVVDRVLLEGFIAGPPDKVTLGGRRGSGPASRASN